MTPIQVETVARRMLNAESSNFWSQAEIMDYIYMSALEMAQETFCIENRYTTTSVADQQEYATPSRMLGVKRVEYAGAKLKPIDFQRLDSINPNSTTLGTGTPQYYYYFDDSFGLYPVPSTAGDTIKIYTYDEPDVPTSSSVLEIPTQYHGKLVLGVAYYMSLKELGHPHVNRFEFQWNHVNNPNSAINQVKRAVKMRNKDNFPIVKREEDLPGTLLGAV